MSVRVSVRHKLVSLNLCLSKILKMLTLAALSNPACTIDRDSRSDFCDRDSRSDFGVVVERANHNFLEGVPSLYL